MLDATGPASGIACTPSAWSPTAATRTDRQPTGRPGRHRIAVADAHLKPTLGRIDGGHPGPEQRAVAFATTLHQINPGVDHLVAERAFRGDLWQGLEHRSGQHDLAAAPLTHPWATAVEPRCTAHPPIAPAHRRQRLAPIHQSTAKMLAVQAVKQRQQRLQRHRTGGEEIRISAILPWSVRLSPVLRAGDGTGDWCVRSAAKLCWPGV